MTFERKLLDEAADLFYKVYVDEETETAYIGHSPRETDTGCRVRIYPTKWEYEEPEIFYTNEDLSNFLEEFKSDMEYIWY